MRNAIEARELTLRCERRLLLPSGDFTHTVVKEKRRNEVIIHLEVGEIPALKSPEALSLLDFARRESFH